MEKLNLVSDILSLTLSLLPETNLIITISLFLVKSFKTS